MISLVTVNPENFQEYQDAILRIERSSFSSPWSRGSFQEETRNPVSRFWVVLLDQLPCGYICFWAYAGEIHLMNIVVAPEMRGRGIGRFLLKKMIEEGISSGSGSVWLEVRPSNLAARKLYGGMGFREVARRRRYYRDTSEDALVMSLELSPVQSPSVNSGQEEPLCKRVGIREGSYRCTGS